MKPIQIFDKYYTLKNKFFDYEKFKSICINDPTSIIKDNTLKKIGIYVKWIFNIQFKKQIDEESSENDINTCFEDLEKICSYLTVFHRHKKKLPVHKRDISLYKKSSDLYKEIKSFTIFDKSTNKNIFDMIEIDVDYKYIGDFNNFKCYIPMNQKGASILGYGTEWCTSYGVFCLSKEHKSKANAFTNYNLDHLYIMINKVNTSIKYQLYFPSMMFMDKNDAPIKSINKFNSLIIYLISQGTLKNKINKLTKNSKYHELYMEELEKKFQNITDLKTYMNLYSLYVDNEFIALNNKMMELINSSCFNDIFIYIIQPCSNNKVLLISIFKSLSKELLNELSNSQRTWITEKTHEIVVYSLSCALHKYGMEVLTNKPSGRRLVNRFIVR